MKKEPSPGMPVRLTLSRTMRTQGVSRAILLEKSGLSAAQLDPYLRGNIQQVDLNILGRICSALRCMVADILAADPNKPSNCAPPTGYRTAQLARLANVHPNTVRFYDQIGILTPVAREPNGYRRYSERNRVQLLLCRCVFESPYLNPRLRAASFVPCEALKAWDLSAALRGARRYIALLEHEYALAMQTTEMLRRWTRGLSAAQTGETYTRRQAAERIGVTPEALRSWERNGLLQVPRQGYARAYGDTEMARLRIIYMLRQTNYAIAAIRASLAQYDAGNAPGALLALHQSTADAVLYESVGNSWLGSLTECAAWARRMLTILEEAAALPEEEDAP